MNYEKLLRLFIPITTSGLLSVRKNSHGRFAEKLGDLTFVTDSITTDNEESTITLRILYFEEYCRLLLGEAHYFLLASRLSHLRCLQEQPQNASWQIIENYYSAFFAAHYLLRISGTSLTHIDSNLTREIKRNYYGSPDQEIKSGIYFITSNEAQSKLTLKQNLTRKPGGSHQDLWKLWIELIDKIKLQTMVDIEEYIDIDNQLNSYKMFLSSTSLQYGPPAVRGKVNYQFKGKSWVFEDKSRDEIRIFQNLIKNSQTEPPNREQTVKNLIFNNMFIINFAFQVFQHYTNNFPRSISRSIKNKYSNLFNDF